nr:hypothetical protein CFP56_03764 [Quercus suber]
MAISTLWLAASRALTSPRLYRHAPPRHVHDCCTSRTYIGRGKMLRQAVTCRTMSNSRSYAPIKAEDDPSPKARGGKYGFLHQESSIVAEEPV